MSKVHQICPICAACNTKQKDGYYMCCACRHKWRDVESSSVFDRIAASPEVLAESVVYTYEMAIGGSMFKVYWTSPFIENFYPDRADAIAATVARLKEVCDGND